MECFRTRGTQGLVGVAEKIGEKDQPLTVKKVGGINVEGTPHHTHHSAFLLVWAHNSRILGIFCLILAGAHLESAINK